MKLRADPPELICDKATRDAAGLDHWVDGTLGIARFDGRTLVVAPNGRQLATHDLTDRDAAAGGFIDGLITSRQTIRGLDPSVDHASGGPLLRDPASGALVLVYHGEHFLDGDPAVYWSFLGMAVSSDDGGTFHDLGPIITVARPPHPDDPTLAEVGSGGFVLRDGWMLLYSMHRGMTTVHTNLAVARCRVDEVFAAAHRGHAPVFTKFHEGTWSEPGLGGAATDLLPGTRHPVMWADLATIGSTGEVLLVYGTMAYTRGRELGWTHMSSTSADGLSFDEPVPLYAEVDRAQLVYLSIDADGDEPRSIAGDRFHLYRVRSTTPYRWDDAVVERVTVHLEPD